MRCNMTKLKVTSQAIDTNAGIEISKAEQIKKRLSEKIGKVPALGKMAAKIKDFDNKMGKSSTYRAAKGLAIGVGLSSAAAQVGVVGGIALTGYYVAKATKPLLKESKNAKKENQASGLFDYMSKNPLRTVQSIMGASISVAAEASSLSGIHEIGLGARFGGAVMAVVPSTLDLGKELVKKLQKNKESETWGKLVDRMSSIGLTLGAYVLRGKGNDSQETNLNQDQTPYHSPQNANENPIGEEPDSQIPGKGDSNVTPDPQKPIPVPVPDKALDIPPADVPKNIDFPDLDKPKLPLDHDVPKGPLPEPEMPEPKESYYSEIYEEGDGFKSFSTTSEVDGKSVETLSNQQNIEGGGRIVTESSVIEGVERINTTYYDAEGNQFRLDDSIKEAFKSIGEGEISNDKLAEAYKNLQNNLSSQLGEETAQNIVKALNNDGTSESITVKSISETKFAEGDKSIEKDFPDLKPHLEDTPKITPESTPEPTQPEPAQPELTPDKEPPAQIKPTPEVQPTHQPQKEPPVSDPVVANDEPPSIPLPPTNENPSPLPEKQIQTPGEPLLAGPEYLNISKEKTKETAKKIKNLRHGCMANDSVQKPPVRTTSLDLTAVQSKGNEK